MSGQTNSPNLKQIYDFQIGDIFLYKITTTVCYTGPGNCSLIASYDKFEIVNRIIKDDSIIYYRKHNYSNNAIDKVVYIDSVNSLLNKNNNDIVMYTNFHDTAFLRVRTENGTIPKKIIGGLGYSYKNKNGKCDTAQVLNHNDLLNSFTYGQGLGLMEASQSQFEIGSSNVLIGYRKGNDTVGTITATKQLKIDTEVQIYPNPFNDQFVIEFSGDVSFDIEIFNLQGCLVKRLIGYKSLIQINGSDLKAGFYLVRLKGRNGYIYKSVIKN